MAVGGLTPRPAHLIPGNDPVLIIQGTEWSPGLVWMGAKNLALTGIRTPDLPARSESVYRSLYKRDEQLHPTILPVLFPVGFVVDKVVQGRFFSKYFYFPLPVFFRHHLSITDAASPYRN